MYCFNIHCVCILLTVLISNAISSDLRCLFPKEERYGRPIWLYYYYNSTTRRCDTLFHTGVGGNDNRFETEAECIDTCEASTSVCILPKDPGSGSGGLYPRYFYNSLTGICELFYYRGSNGNGNKFLTLKKCQNRCEQLMRRVCLQHEMRPGHCRQNLKRYFFNKHTLQCEPFIYSGCSGNENQFESMEDCELSCSAFV